MTSARFIALIGGEYSGGVSNLTCSTSSNMLIDKIVVTISIARTIKLKNKK